MPTVQRWAARYRQLGASGMADRSSRPHRCPSQTPTRTERRIIKLPGQAISWAAVAQLLSIGSMCAVGEPGSTV